jgi:hypothetical protein
MLCRKIIKDLKGRPIISTTNSIVKPLAQLFAKVLMSLIALNVNAYLKSTSDFINALKLVHLDES